MSVVAPLTAVVSAVVPVVTGLALGERPSAWALLGVALALPAIALIARETAEGHRRADAGVLLAALAAGAGFGFFFVALARTTGDTGLWPLVAARVASISLLATRAGRDPAPAGGGRPALAMILTAGVLDTTANALYLAAASRGLLSLVAVIAALTRPAPSCWRGSSWANGCSAGSSGASPSAALAVALVAASS